MIKITFIKFFKIDNFIIKFINKSFYLLIKTNYYYKLQ